MAAYICLENANIPNDVIDDIAKRVHKMNMNPVHTDISSYKYGELESFFLETENPTFEKLKKQYSDAELLKDCDIEWTARMIKLTPTKFFLGYYYFDDTSQSQQFHLIEGEFCDNSVFLIDRLWVTNYDEKFVFEYVEDLVNSYMTDSLMFLCEKFNIFRLYYNGMFITSSTSGRFLNPYKLFKLFME